MRPVTSDNPGYEPPETVLIRKLSTRTYLGNEGINPERGTITKYKVAELISFLKEMTEKNRGAPKWGNLDANQKLLMPALMTLFSGSGLAAYGNARGALLHNYGQYCSYCGMPVQDSSLAIEHILPKSEFPDEMIAYKNFFLACPSCNSKKGAKPSFLEALNWTENERGIPSPDYNKIKEGGFDMVLWPTSNEAFTGFHLVLFGDDGNEIPWNQSLALTNKLISTNNNEVTAGVEGFKDPIKVYAIFSGRGNGLDLKRRTNLIDMVGLNDSVQGAYSDRRVTNRTVAWFNALDSSQRLLIVYHNDGTDEKVIYKMMLFETLKTVKNAGYLSVWMTVFAAVFGVSEPLVPYLVLRESVTDADLPLHYMRGTNKNGLPDN